jgi:putative resolvase
MVESRTCPGLSIAHRHHYRVARLQDPAITHIVVEHKDRLTRFGFRYLETLLEQALRHMEVVNLAENDREDLLADLVSSIYSNERSTS